jgi:translation initiation factor 1
MTVSSVKHVASMDLADQLKNLFPDHLPENSENDSAQAPPEESIWLQEDPILCKFEKRRGKPVTLLEGYNGAEKDFRLLTRELQTLLGVGGSFKDDRIIIQGDNRDRIMKYLQEKGFSVKRVGG